VDLQPTVRAIKVLAGPHNGFDSESYGTTDVVICDSIHLFIFSKLCNFDQSYHRVAVVLCYQQRK